MPAPADLVHQTTTTTGTGALTLTAENGKRTFLAAFGTGGTNTFDYYVSNRDAAEWERGTGHESSGTLVRDTVIASSNSNNAVNFSAGTKDVTNDVPAGTQRVLDSIYTPERFGAAGDGTTDDAPEWDTMLDALDAAGGGEVWGLPGASYYFDLTGESNGFVYHNLTNFDGFTLKGRGTAIEWDHAFSNGQAAYGFILTNVDYIDVNGMEFTAETGHGGDGNPKGIRHFYIREGSDLSSFRNLTFTGGIGGIFIEAIETVSGTDDPNYQVVIENARFTNTFYAVSLQGGNNCIVKNLKTEDGGRSLFVSDVCGLEASVDSFNHTHDDIILYANSDTSAAGYGRVLGPAEIKYRARSDSGTQGNSVALLINTTTASPQACQMRNIDIEVDIDGTGSSGVSGVLTFVKLKDLVADGTQRGHIVDGLRLRGTAIGLTGSGGVVFDSNMKVGDVFRNVEIGPLYMRGQGGSLSPITIDGAAFTTPLVLHDIDIDGNLTLTNFAPGMVQMRNVVAANYGRVGEPVYTAAYATGVNFNSVADTALTVKLPPGYTKYRIQALMLYSASASVTTAQFALYTAAAAGGTAVVSPTTCLINTASANTNQGLHAVNPSIQATMDDTTLFFRITTPQGSAATASVALQIQPLP